MYVCMQARPILTHAVEGGSFEELVDPRLENRYNPQEMRRMVVCAAASIRHSARRRPRMSQVHIYFDLLPKGHNAPMDRVAPCVGCRLSSFSDHPKIYDIFGS